MHSRTLLRVERLEDRCTPATWNNPWPDAAHLSLSFVPDGTGVGASQSNLFSLLNAVRPTSQWQREVLRAFQTWAVNANINLSVVADQGLALGATGAIQGDARFGDIRLAAYPFPFAAPATASPYQLDGGTWSGDVTLNSAASLGIGGSGQYDLFSVLLHEAGHVFGLDHSTDPRSPLFEDYRGVRTGLTADDIARLHAIYGARTRDSFEGTSGNNQISTATRLNSLLNLTSAAVEADITTLQDRDVFAFTSLLGIGGAIIQVRTAGVSLLTPRVSVFDSAGRQIVSAASVDPMQGGLSIRLSNLRAFSTYYVRIESAQQDVFGIGSYQLTVNPLPLVNGLVGGVTATVSYGLNAVTGVLLNNDLHTNDSILTALNLTQTLAQPDARFDYAFRGSISDSWDVDYYRIQSPAASAGAELVLSALVWGLQDNGLDPRVRVFDANRNPVAAEVLVNNNHSYTIQVRGARPQATYYIEVLPASDDPPTGNYFVGVDFSSRAVELQDFVGVQLDEQQREVTTALTMHQNRLFHFVLSADAHAAPVRTKVVMNIIDADGRIVFTLKGSSQEAVTGNVYLRQGVYRVTFSATAPGGATMPILDCKVRGTILNDPIGPEPVDPTGDPAGSPNYEPPPPYDWSGGDSTGVPPSDPSSDPYGTSSTSSSDSPNGLASAEDEDAKAKATADDQTATGGAPPAP